MFKPDSFLVQRNRKDRHRFSEISVSFSFASYIYIWKTNALIILATHLEIQMRHLGFLSSFALDLSYLINKWWLKKNLSTFHLIKERRSITERKTPGCYCVGPSICMWYYLTIPVFSKSIDCIVLSPEKNYIVYILLIFKFECLCL